MPSKTMNPRKVAARAKKRHATKSRAFGRSRSQLSLTKSPVAKTGMLIRKPVAEVFEAIVNPDVTTQFWFTQSSGRLEVDQPVKWEWEMYNVSTRVVPKLIEPQQRIVMQWDGYGGSTQVEWTFTPLRDDATFVSVKESGWKGTGDELAKYAADSAEGFAWTLAGLKALLEHGVKLNLVADRFPQGLEAEAE